MAAELDKREQSSFAFDLKHAAHSLADTYYANIALNACSAAMTTGRAHPSIQALHDAASGRDPALQELVQSGPYEHREVVRAILTATARTPGAVTAEQVNAALKAAESTRHPGQGIENYVETQLAGRGGVLPDVNAAYWLQHYARARELSTSVDAGAYVAHIKDGIDPPAFQEGGPALALARARARDALGNAERAPGDAAQRYRETPKPRHDEFSKVGMVFSSLGIAAVAGGAVLGATAGDPATGALLGSIVGGGSLALGLVQMADWIKQSVDHVRAKWGADRTERRADRSVRDAKRAFAAADEAYHVGTSTAHIGQLPPAHLQPDVDRKTTGWKRGR